MKDRIICPIDQHECTRESCLRNQNDPDCTHTADNLAEIIPMYVNQKEINKVERSPVSGNLTRSEAYKVADDLGVDPEKFYEAVSVEIREKGFQIDSES